MKSFALVAMGVALAVLFTYATAKRSKLGEGCADSGSCVGDLRCWGGRCQMYDLETTASLDAYAKSKGLESWTMLTFMETQEALRLTGAAKP